MSIIKEELVYMGGFRNFKSVSTQTSVSQPGFRDTLGPGFHGELSGVSVNFRKSLLLLRNILSVL